MTVSFLCLRFIFAKQPFNPLASCHDSWPSKRQTRNCGCDRRRHGGRWVRERPGERRVGAGLDGHNPDEYELKTKEVEKQRLGSWKKPVTPSSSVVDNEYEPGAKATEGRAESEGIPIACESIRLGRVGERPRGGEQRHPIAPYLAATAFTRCGTYCRTIKIVSKLELLRK